MKKLLSGMVIAASALMATSAQAADGKVHFKGQLAGLKDSLVVLVPAGDDFKKDTILTPNGKFEFTVEVSKPTTIYLYTPASLRREENVGLQALAVPGETAEVSGDLAKSYHITGSPFYKQYDEIDRVVEAANKPMSEFMTALNKRMEAGESREALMKEYQAKMPAFAKTKAETILNFIKTHPTYEASAAFIPELKELDMMKQAVSYLAPAVRDGRMKSLYQGTIDEVEAQAKAEQESAAKQAAGVMAPDFTLNDINGKPLKLSSLRGKYVILDFWGSWCGWCIKGFPEMKKYYEKYKDKLEILGIDCNDTEAKWKEAVAKHSLPWLHVFNPRSNSTIKNAYGINGFPTKIIVGPDGKIVKSVVGEDPAFYTFLDETFGR